MCVHIYLFGYKYTVIDLNDRYIVRYEQNKFGYIARYEDNEIDR